MDLFVPAQTYKQLHLPTFILAINYDEVELSAKLMGH